MLHILTLTYNGLDKLTKLKDSLLPAISNIDYTWFIKDNASTDGTAEAVSKWDGNIKLIKYHNNLQNFSQGTNMCFNEASPNDDDYVLLLNNDIIFNDTISIHKMIKLMEEDSRIGVVGARLLFTDTNKLQHAGVVFNNSYKAPAHFRLNDESDHDAEKNRFFQVVTGAVLLTKAKYYRAVQHNPKSGNDGMDEKYHWGFDDVDLCLAIKYNMEKDIVYCGGTNIYHEDSGSLKKVPTNKLFLNHNLSYLKNKWEKHYCLDQDIYNKYRQFNLYNR